MDEQQTFRWTDLNLFCLLRRLGRDVLLVVAAGLIAAMLTETAIQNLYKPEYTASATMAVSVKSGGYSSVLSNLNMSSEIADTFTKLFESNMFGGIASSKLGTSSLPGKLTASVLPETNILTLRVTADSPEDAFRTLQLLLDNYDTVSEYVFQNVILKELDSPSVPVKPSNPVNRGQLLKRAFVGGAGAMMVLLLAIAVLSDTVQTSEAVRRKLDVKLFATIHHEEKNKTLRTKLKRPIRACSSPCRWPASISRRRSTSWGQRWTTPPATGSGRSSWSPAWRKTRASPPWLPTWRCP